jgi:hypothetical protein
MQPIQRDHVRRLGLCCLLALAAAGSADALPVAWQHHHTKFAYVGMTTLYACDALESQVKRILTYFGARPDVKVTAACSQPVLPTRHAVIDVDFYSPAVAEGSSGDTATGRWTTVELQSGHPHFIDAGDCDLIEDMKALVTGSFALRGLDYSTSCFPNALTLHDFAVKGEALKVTPPTRG